MQKKEDKEYDLINWREYVGTIPEERLPVKVVALLLHFGITLGGCVLAAVFDVYWLIPATWSVGIFLMLHYRMAWNQRLCHRDRHPKKYWSSVRLAIILTLLVALLPWLAGKYSDFP
ncbi:MAG: hypothetical protein AAGG50_20260 [Bacteroidota bacterium]